MELYVLRHAIAVDRGTAQYAGNDSARPLTDEGARKMRRGAKGIDRMGLEPTLILSSPYRRARETAEIVADTLDLPSHLEMFPALGAEVPANEAVEAIAERSEGLESLLVVGHEPQLSGVASILLSGEDELSLHLGKGGLFKMECSRLEPGCATLEWWLAPKQLRRMAR